MKQNILAVGAHPDDIELGCGGTVAKHLELGDSIYVIIMTNGENGNHPSDKSECLKSLKKMGIKKENIIFGNFPDGDLSDDNGTVSFIENQIKKFNITKVYTHNPNDRHQDHRNCSNAVSSAARDIPEILFFEGPSTKVSFEPHYFVEISEKNLKKKIDSLKAYKTQLAKNSILNLEWVKNLAKVNGMRCNSKYSEAFEINHILKEGKNV